MISIKKLKKLCEEGVRAYEQGILNLSVCGEREIQISSKTFFKMFSHWETTKFCETLDKLVVLYDGYEFFTLVDKEGR